MWPAGGAEDRERAAVSPPTLENRNSPRKKKKKKAFLNTTIVKNKFHFSPDNTTPKGCKWLFYATHMLYTTIMSVRDAAVFSGPGDGSYPRAPAADVEAAFGQLASLNSVTLTALTCYRDPLGAVPARCVPASAERRACVVWRYVTGSGASGASGAGSARGAVAMDRLNTLCTIHALRSRPVGQIRPCVSRPKLRPSRDMEYVKHVYESSSSAWGRGRRRSEP